MDLSPLAGSPEVTLAFFAHVRELMARRDPTIRFLGVTGEGGRALADLVSRADRFAWNMQRLMTFHAQRDGRSLTEDLRRRRVPMRLVVNPAAPAFSPILSSYTPYLRLGPVFAPMLIVDGQHVVVPGTDGDSIWASSDPEVVDFGIRAYEAVWSLSVLAVPEGEDPPLTPRMVDIAWLLAEGASDRVISRELGISERTVSAEVREMGRRLGTTNRSHTIARICGAPL